MTKMQKVEMFLNGNVIIDEECVDSLRFFERKHKGKTLFSFKRRLSLRPDLVTVCKIIFTDPRFDSYIQMLKDVREACPNRSTVNGRDLSSMCSFLDIIDRLECFYDLNKGTETHGIKDKRAHLFVALKADVIRAIKFLERRAGPSLKRRR